MAGECPAAYDPELLANGVFSSCLRRWKSSYDFVLLDSPPVLPVADARILAGQVDGTIMVLRASHSRRDEVVQAYADLSAAGGTLLGTMLVGVQTPSSYGYYNDYVSPDAQLLDVKS
jgi:non-specific protein-tyrosine kinase